MIELKEYEWNEDWKVIKEKDEEEKRRGACGRRESIVEVMGDNRVEGIRED